MLQVENQEKVPQTTANNVNIFERILDKSKAPLALQKHKYVYEIPFIQTKERTRSIITD